MFIYNQLMKALKLVFRVRAVELNPENYSESMEASLIRDHSHKALMRRKEALVTQELTQIR
jgi:hypothetical protein